MKKKIILVFSILSSYLSIAQTPFDKFEGNSNISSVIVNDKMFELMSKVKMETKEDQAYLNLIKKLDYLKVFRTTHPKSTSEIRASVEQYSDKLEELMRVNENGKSSKIYVKTIPGTTNVSELLLLMEGKETVLMSLTGDFSLNEISLLTKRMNLPGGEELNKAAKK
ncbi:DUF4252 domain-containing protein [Flavobacterium oreochromis]|uniref:DUF4252 domain-containing protein n=2 Tax=Flavobacterium TaxID=237 RepID=A0A246G7R2_9FLAO|nr:DUF4252 domain-containing protein [Flavobacterium oreochromis]OWP74424.1 hypothetical protein BWG23_13980 [Flavobacterium oreochromis]OWP74604.1 hypothetical protein BWK62_13895 [Flavobacterium oreochromis]POR22883.1 hypothetical protein BWK58_10595 [Flavobacterium columnare]QYS85518.1 DUF4252 domain-containing protein [Flavobacterium oreochromis]